MGDLIGGTNMDKVDLKDLWEKRIGLFCVLDFNTPAGKKTAVGKLEFVTEEGLLIIRSLKNKEKTWDVRIEDIRNSSCEPIKEVEEDD